MGKICKWLYANYRRRKSEAQNAAIARSLIFGNKKPTGALGSKSKTKIIGDYAENQALKFLKKSGLVFVEKNFSCKMGEIDLIMRDGKTLVFIEVRYRKTNKFGGALASLTKEKERRLKNTAAYYLNFRKFANIRFDFVIMTLGSEKKLVVEDWIKNVFES